MEQFLENLDMHNLLKSLIDNDSDYDDEVPEVSNINPETDSMQLKQPSLDQPTSTNNAKEPKVTDKTYRSL